MLCVRRKCKAEKGSRSSEDACETYGVWVVTQSLHSKWPYICSTVFLPSFLTYQLHQECMYIRPDMYSTAQWPLTNTVNFSCRDCPVHPLLVAQSERQAKTEDSFVVCFFYSFPRNSCSAKHSISWYERWAHLVGQCLNWPRDTQGKH